MAVVRLFSFQSLKYVAFELHCGRILRHHTKLCENRPMSCRDMAKNVFRHLEFKTFKSHDFRHSHNLFQQKIFHQNLVFY